MKMPNVNLVLNCQDFVRSLCHAKFLPSLKFAKLIRLLFVIIPVQSQFKLHEINSELLPEIIKKKVEIVFSNNFVKLSSPSIKITCEINCASEHSNDQI